METIQMETSLLFNNLILILIICLLIVALIISYFMYAKMSSYLKEYADEIEYLNNKVKSEEDRYVSIRKKYSDLVNEVKQIIGK